MKKFFEKLAPVPPKRGGKHKRSEERGEAADEAREKDIQRPNSPKRSKYNFLVNLCVGLFLFVYYGI